MPFDGAGFPAKPDPPRRSAPTDNMASLIIILLAFGLLVMPISMGAFIDIVHYLRSH